MAKHDFHIYASTKTTAQLILDLAAAVSHAFTLLVLLQMGTAQRDGLWKTLFYLVCVTIGIQCVLAIGLFFLRLKALDNGHGKIPKAVRYLNNIFFWACLLVGLLEVVIAGIEKLALDKKHSGHCSPNPPIIAASDDDTPT